MIYFDNGATTFPKPDSVIYAVEKFIREMGGNPSRSSHKLSRAAGEEVYKAREAVCKLLHFDTPENIVFTYNATYALNMAIKSMIREKCHIICSDIEHNSVIRPINSLRERLGVEYSIFDSNISPDISIPPLIRDDTRFIISTLSSNVTGKEIDMYLLSKVAKEYSLRLIMDASQSAGHKEIDISKCPCDALCAPGHKALFGIQGSGFVYFKNGLREGEFIEGGSGTNSIYPNMPIWLPEAYEAGTLGTPAIVALRHGIEFIKEIGIDNITYHLNRLRCRAFEGLKQIEGVLPYKTEGGITLFNLSGIDSNELSYLLDKKGVCVRGGLHCAPSAHRKIGTLDSGAVRLSFSIMNSEKEVDEFLSIMESIAKKHVK